MTHENCTPVLIGKHKKDIADFGCDIFHCSVHRDAYHLCIQKKHDNIKAELALTNTKLDEARTQRNQALDQVEAVQIEMKALTEATQERLSKIQKLAAQMTNQPLATEIQMWAKKGIKDA